MRVTLRQLISAIGGLAVIIALAVVAQSKAGQSALRALGVAANPPRYSELAFVDPLHLPTAVRSTPTTLQLPFTITNRQGTTQGYGWTISSADPRVRALRSGTLTLPPGAQALLEPPVTVTCTRRTRITVAISSGQQIGLWATCLQRKRPGAAPASRRRSRRRGRRAP